MIVPTPEQAAALRRLNMLRSGELPMIAAYWLIDLDTPALRQLAGIDRSHGWLIDQTWNETMEQLGVGPVTDQAAWTLAASYEVAALRAGDKSVDDVVREVVGFYIDNDYPSWAPEAGHLYGLADEFDGDWGRAPEDVLAEVSSTLEELATRVRTAS